MKQRNSMPQRKKSKTKKAPNPPASERKQENVQQAKENVSPTVDEEQPVPPPIEQITVIVEQSPTEESMPATPILTSPDQKNDSIDFSVKHPLNSKWTLWYYNPEKNVDWEKCQHKIHTIDTVEDFWCLADHLKPPSELLPGVDYSFFKNGIRPMWEDPQNISGGRLTVISAHKSRSNLIDEVWLDTLLYLIGEDHSNADNLCGVVINIRGYGMKIAIWTSTNDSKKVDEIKKSIKAALSTQQVQTMQFEVHEDTQKKAQTYTKSSSRGPMN